MLQAAKRTAIPGKSQVVPYTGVIPTEPEPTHEVQSIIKLLQYAAANVQTETIKSGLAKLFDLWKSEGCPLLSAEMTLTRLVQAMAQSAPPGHGLSHRNITEGVQLLCRESADYTDMRDKAWVFCNKLYLSLERQSESGQLIHTIETYIREHLGEPLSAQSICSVFGLSVSNLHRVFRKHVKMSYVEYITAMRIKEAKRMMTAYPDMPIKDIAGFLGFSDQFYFSKVFRSLTGASPSEYRLHADGKMTE
jgi:AraC-like DNA-binding protein